MTDQELSEAPETGRKRNLSTALPIAVGLVIVALLAYGFLTSRESGRPQRGELAPDFTLALLDGSQVTLSDLRGQVVVLNFWASWCSPCRREAPALQSVWETYHNQGVAFVGVTYRDAKEASRAFVEEYGLTYPNGLDEMGRVSSVYGVTAVPETYVIDRTGRIAWFQIGEVQAAELARQVEQAGE
jgi:cytochrome c biogenesis protein CcmG/thiol:disulfide interchange protein DsbE